MSDAISAFWDAVDAELATIPMAAELHALPVRSTDSSTTYAVRLTSLGPYRIFGYYSVPKATQRVAGLLCTPRYGSVNHVPDYQDRQRYAVLQLIHRGQRLADQPFAAAYPGLLTLGIDSPETYIYRGIVADCLRGAEFLLSRAEVDQDRVGILGDDLALLTAARRTGFKALHARELLLYRLLDAAEQTDAYPIEEINDFLRTSPGSRETIARTLTYFDPRNHVRRIRAATLLVDGGDTWLQPLHDAFAGPIETYRLSHNGSRDQQWQDAWLATQLGTEPCSRFLDRPIPHV